MTPPRLSTLIRSTLLIVAVWLVPQHGCCRAEVYLFSEHGGLAANDNEDWNKRRWNDNQAWNNSEAWNSLMKDTLQPGDTLKFDEGLTFFMMGGVHGSNLTNVTFVFDGEIWFGGKFTSFLKRGKFLKNWPRDSYSKKPLECIRFTDTENVKFTSTISDGGVLWGWGQLWWGIPGIGYLAREENRPRLFHLENSKDILFENIMLKDSPYWSFYAQHANGLEIRHSTVDVRRRDIPGTDSHNLLQLSAFNTDGFDVQGKNVWIHDVNIWNQDDCIAVKGNSENMLFENVVASGMGLTIGSIGEKVVKNITFRNSVMNRTVKGIYIKYNAGANKNSLISNVTYENITLNEPSRAIWIGPAQQSDSKNPFHGNPCSLFWPWLPTAQCHIPDAPYANITLSDITVKNPKKPKNYILGSESNLIVNLNLHNVVMEHTPKKGFFKKIFQKIFQKKLSYDCRGVKSYTATGSTSPVPNCTNSGTSSDVTTVEVAQIATISSIIVQK